MEPDQKAGQGIGIEPGHFCKHRRSIVKRWQEGDQWFAILKCRWCDDWTRKVISLKQDSQAKTIGIKTQAFLEVQEVDTNTGTVL
jgi:hypothetical protein